MAARRWLGLVTALSDAGRFWPDPSSIIRYKNKIEIDFFIVFVI